MTENSLQAFVNPENQGKRQTRKEMILASLKREPNQSRFSIGRNLGIDDIEAQRRLSDLYNEGKVQITGSRKHGDNEVSLYSLTEQLTIVGNKPSLRRWLEKENPEILHKYDALYNHKL